MNSIIRLISEMEEYFDGCKKSLFSNKVLVDMEIIYDLMTELRLKMPEEIKRSERLLDEKEKILLEAKQNADNIEKQTENRMLQMINEHEIMQKAYSQAEEILTEAKLTSRELKLGAYEYADEIINKIKETTKDTLVEVHDAYMKYEEIMKNQLETLEDNRQDLQDRKIKKAK